MMLGFDVLIVLCSIVIFLINRNDVVCKLVIFQILAQFIFDLIYFEFGLSSVVSDFWFYFIKSYVSFAILIFGYKMKVSKILIFFYFMLMLYYDGLMYESYFEKGFFDSNFNLFMVSGAVIQLIFMCGRIEKIKDIYGKSRTFVSRAISNVFYKCVRSIAIQNSGAEH